MVINYSISNAVFKMQIIILIFTLYEDLTTVTDLPIAHSGILFFGASSSSVESSDTLSSML